MKEHRPDPDLLLASLHLEEAKATLGRLKIFFGMCPGVGKTYAMLEAAHREVRDGRKLVVGVVETHGRAETEALVAGLTLIPRKKIAYRGAELSEMDLEAVLACRPQLVLVDELAHTNAPELRHPKRYQDVIELLDAGINVYSTLNVQHIESRADAVRQITGAPVHETVPDSILERADQIELVDITAEALLERLGEGKVYLGERAKTAAAHFFQDANLTALRELALRFTAERVEKHLRDLRARGPGTIWRSGERLIVAVGPSPSSRRLVRWTRRMAASQGASWIAVSVETSGPLEGDAKRNLDRNLALARELGAEVVLTHDEEVADALVRVALQNNATQIVVGKPQSPRWLDRLRSGNLVDKLLRISGPIDIYVVPAERAAGKPGAWIEWRPAMPSPLREYAAAVATIAAVSATSWFLADVIGYRPVGVIFLLMVIGLSLRLGRGPVLFSGVLAALAWNYFFIPPRFTFVISSADDVSLYVATVIAAIVAGQLTARIREQAKNERMREERATALFHLTRALSGARTLDEGVFAALRQADLLFGAKTALLVVSDDGQSLVPHFAGSFSLSEKERSVSDWVWRQRKNAGRFTSTLPLAEGFHMPLLREDRAVGVFVVYVGPEVTLTLAQRDLLESYAAQLALLVEREQLRSAGEREKLLAESDKLHRALLDGVSHELKTPLAVLGAAAENLPVDVDSPVGKMAHEIRTATRRLNRLVGNLLDQTRLETGALRSNLDWCDPNDLINSALDGISESLADHPLEVDVPDDMPLFRADAALMEQVIANLLLNAALHTPAGTPLFLAVGIDRAKNRVFFTVADRGPGLPPEMRGRMFQKFQRGDSARVGGLGLGLSIIRGFVAAQGGEVVAGENPGGGAVFTVYLPHETHEDVPNE
jgi:two-component system, OmpR family, sensor histidine kinase KdpD